jgi:hypothetical protein
MLNISSTSAYAILHYDLRYRKLCAKLVLRELIDTHKEQRVELATQFLQRHDDNPGLLDRIFTGDETWVRHFVPEIKGENMEWKQLASPRKKFINFPSAKKILLSSSGI